MQFINTGNVQYTPKARVTGSLHKNGEEMLISTTSSISIGNLTISHLYQPSTISIRQLLLPARTTWWLTMVHMTVKRLPAEFMSNHMFTRNYQPERLFRQIITCLT